MHQNYWKLRFQQYSDIPQRQYATGKASSETEITLSETIHITRPYPLGPTVMISLGLFIVLLWTLFHLIPALRFSTSIHTSLAYRSAKPDAHGFNTRGSKTSDELEQEYAADLYAYKMDQLRFYPEPATAVYLRGNILNKYHWHKSCPLFSTKPCYNKHPQRIITMTRQQAEASRKVACSYCCEISKAKQLIAGK